MTLRKVSKAVSGMPAVDGAGVHLTRVLGPQTVRDFDPFLMLDSFDSTNPEDYVKGFPMHPHRGIETITYLIEGQIEHQDSLGNQGTINPGESQWMTAGSGILHQEMPKAAPRMLGLQIWLNLPQTEKMTHPTYFDIKGNMIRAKQEDFGVVRVLSGRYKDAAGVEPPHWQADIWDITLEQGKEVALVTRQDDNVFVFLILGDALIDDDVYAEKTAVLFGPGDEINIKAADGVCRFLYFAGKPIKESVAWGGPIVMNTGEELEKAFSELQHGTFIKHNAVAKD